MQNAHRFKHSYPKIEKFKIEKNSNKNKQKKAEEDETLLLIVDPISRNYS